jgi:hypothetical protein
MYPRPFHYHRASSLKEAAGILAQIGDGQAAGRWAEPHPARTLYITRSSIFENNVTRNVVAGIMRRVRAQSCPASFPMSRVVPRIACVRADNGSRSSPRTV